MNTNARKAITATLFSLAIGAFSGSISADDGKRVDFADLDPASPADVAVMYERITHAAETVCRQASSPWDGRKNRHFDDCVRGALDQAVQDINLTTLTDLHQGSYEEKIAGR